MAKIIKIIILFLLISTLIVFLNSQKILTKTYSSNCLESKNSDTKFFGYSLVANKDYLAVGDPEANRVVLYKRKIDGNWLRLREVYPPKNSLSKLRGYGFGVQIALNKNILAIRGFDYKNAAEKSLKKIKLDFENYVTEIDINKTKSVKEIKIPDTDLLDNELKFLNDKIVFFGRKNNSSDVEKINFYLIDPFTTKIIKKLNLAALDNYPKNNDSVNKGNRSYSIFDSNNQTLAWGLDSKKNILHTINSNYKLEQIVLPQQILDLKSVSKNYNFNPIFLSIEKDFLALGIEKDKFSRYTVFLKRSPQLSFVDYISELGIIDIKDSLALITVNKYDFFSGVKDDYHILIKLERDRIVTESQIRWERSLTEETNEQLIPTVGLIDLDTLLFSKDGVIIRLPIKNLPNSYEIKNDYCRKK